MSPFSFKSYALECDTLAEVTKSLKIKASKQLDNQGVFQALISAIYGRRSKGGGGHMSLIE